MPRVTMAFYTEHHIARRFGRQHVVYEIFVAIEARILRYSPVTRLDLDGFVKIIEGKCDRVKKSVVRLGHPFPDGIVG